jgi:light-regulated signal transduction histidine kinase (bacteriophytochrome)
MGSAFTGQAAAASADLAACEREPIHIPGSIQPYGMLLVLRPGSLELLQASANAAPLLGGDVAAALGRPLGEVLGGAGGDLLDELRSLPADGGHYLRLLTVVDAEGSRTVHAIAHQADGAVILELEERAGRRSGSFDDVYPLVRAFVEELHQCASLEALCTLAAREVRRMTGFDRVLVYQFDEDWNGMVIAEDRNEVLPSYHDLRFPASDIPAQARDLYRRNRLRLIADVDYRPVPLVPRDNPLSGRPLDLSLAVLRSVSPIHLEYMRNMGTGSSMSISLICNGRLWGLISCHSRAPRRVAFHVRTAGDHLAQLLALQIQARERAQNAELRMTLRAIQVQLLADMAEEERFLDGLVRDPGKLLGLVGATGAAVVFAGTCVRVGNTPSEAQIEALVAWLAERGERDVFHTECLSLLHEGAAAYPEVASGMLAAAISQIHPGYVLWFRPEVVHTVKWGGDPRKLEVADAAGRIHPRRSFELWRETVRLRSRPWAAEVVDAAGELRAAIVGIVLRKAEELAALSGELERSNKELEAFSYSVSHDLRAPFRHIVGYAELLREREGATLSPRGRHYVDSIIEAALSAGTLVDNLLSFSQMGRAALNIRLVDMDQLAVEARRRIEPDAEGRAIEWRVQPLGSVEADPAMLRLVLQNLFANAVKFTRGRERAVIEVGVEEREGERVFHVRDNGVGFDMAYVGKLFGVFQRLHRMDDFEGTGIGLANVKRIVERHGGRTWAQGAENKGATFYFALPLRAPRE